MLRKIGRLIGKLLGVDCHLLNYLHCYGVVPSQRLIEQGDTADDWEVTVGRWQVIVSKVKRSAASPMPQQEQEQQRAVQ